MQACRAVLPAGAAGGERGLPFADARPRSSKQGYVEEALRRPPGRAAAPRGQPDQHHDRPEPPRGDAPPAAASRRGSARPAFAATQGFTRWLSEPTLRARTASRFPCCRRPRAELREPGAIGHARRPPAHAAGGTGAPGPRPHRRRRRPGAPAAQRLVPRADLERMLAFLGANVGDHLGAAVDNVLTDGARHFEQALSRTNCPKPRCSTRDGQRRMAAPAAHAGARAAVADRRRQGRRPPADQRMRIGLFAFTDAMPPAGDAPTPPLSAPRRSSHVRPASPSPARRAAAHRPRSPCSRPWASSSCRPAVEAAGAAPVWQRGYRRHGLVLDRPHRGLGLGDRQRRALRGQRRAHRR